MNTPDRNYPLPADNDQHVRQMELLVSRLLRTGVVISVLLVCAGMFATFFQHPEYLRSSESLDATVRPGASFPHDLTALCTGIGQFQGDAIVTFGLLVLMATPVVRVAISIFAFVRQRDQTYTIITAVVLGLLLLSLVLGKVE